MEEIKAGDWIAATADYFEGLDAAVVVLRYRDDGGWDVIAFTGNGPEGKANARLIAAAPELLEAARTVLNGLEARIKAERVETQVSVDILALLAAIAKAEGGAF